MPAVSLPFVVALLLVILLVRLWNRSDGGRSDRAAMIFVAMCTVLVTIVGLRWSVDLALVRFIQPIAASMLPSVAWLCFAGLALDRPARWPHALPVVLVAILSASWRFWHSPIDVVLAVLFIGYGVALLRLAVRGPDAFGASRLSEAGSAQKATAIVGLMLMGGGCVDLAVAVDFGITDGAHAARIVGAANLVTLIVAAYAVAMAGRSRPADAAESPTTRTPASDAPTPEPGREAAPPDADIVAAIDRLMRERGLFRDPDLTLDRLARRAGIPARQISAAINRVHGRNVSQVVNEYRIAEARRLLTQSSDAVTEIMFACGFQTKSNFNREFRRVTGMSPSDYRRHAGSMATSHSTVTLASAPPPGTP
jgi:AraC-like DNA-binding protein